jgi:cytochrome c oxidase subunit IV
VSVVAVHGPTRRVYVGIFVALLCLTAATVGAAELDLGPFNNVVMLGIAVTKATLVVLWFMHVRYGPRLIHVVVGAGLAWLAILLVFVLADYMTRTPILGAIIG